MSVSSSQSATPSQVLDPAPATDCVAALAAEIRLLRRDVEKDAERVLASWPDRPIRPQWQEPRMNLARYLALRSRDLGALQQRLSKQGLSSLGRLEGRVSASLAMIARLLESLAEQELPVPAETDDQPHGVAEHLKVEASRIFGLDPRGSSTRILVTLPDEEGHDPSYVEQLIKAGADSFRINCAKGDAASWASMIKAVRTASREQGRDCPVAMDLGGPKIRIGQLVGPVRRRLLRGDRFRIASALPAEDPSMPVALLREAAIVAELRVGQLAWFDDGKLRAEVVSVDGRGAELEVRHARPRGVRLKVGKGIHFPELELDQPALTSKDLADLDFVAAEADIVAFSFVRSAADVATLQRELAIRRGRKAPQPLVLKIEQCAAVADLPAIIEQSASVQPTAVMIARGDLALDIGFARLPLVQEEILCLCEAAAVPVIWATEVLQTMVKTGVPTRSEATDAASAQRAECVMLNKGPHLVEAVSFLDELLLRRDDQMTKKSPRMSAFNQWSIPLPPA